MNLFVAQARPLQGFKIFPRLRHMLKKKMKSERPKERRNETRAMTIEISQATYRDLSAH